MITNEITFLYSEYLNIHMTLYACFDDFHLKSQVILPMETVCQDSYSCTSITKPGILKCLYLQHSYSIFVIAPFKKEMLNVFPRKKQNKTDQTSYTQLAFSSDAF